MSNRLARYGFVVFSAAGVAFGLYILAHDGLGIPDRSIRFDCFGSAAALAAVCVIASFANRRIK